MTVHELHNPTLGRSHTFKINNIHSISLEYKDFISKVFSNDSEAMTFTYHNFEDLNITRTTTSLGCFSFLFH
jgi:hypothetical protein